MTAFLLCSHCRGRFHRWLPHRVGRLAVLCERCDEDLAETVPGSREGMIRLCGVSSFEYASDEDLFDASYELLAGSSLFASLQDEYREELADLMPCASGREISTDEVAMRAARRVVEREEEAGRMVFNGDGLLVPISHESAFGGGL